MNSGLRPVAVNHRRLAQLLVFHGFVTLGAGIALVAAPGLIPSTVGIRLEPRAYLVAYLLAGAEFGFAALSFGGSRVTDTQAMLVIVWSCIAFHASSAALEAYAYVQGVGAAIVGNIAARLFIIVLFLYTSRRDPLASSATTLPGPHE
jgi:hypothetical protein